MQVKPMNHTPNSTKAAAEEDLRSAIRGLKAIKITGEDLDDTITQLTANNVFQEEIGAFGPYGKHYAFDHKIRDILIAHGREDAAASRIAASKCLSHIKKSVSFSQLALILSAANSLGILYLILQK
jgi:hypothetical protein